MLDFGQQNHVSPEVYHAVNPQIHLEMADIEKLKELALLNPRERIRFCSHKTSEETTQEMFIVHPQGAYVRPHKHLNKIESMMVLQGEVDYVTFDDEGKVTNKISMGDFSSGKTFYNSLRTDIYHSLLIRSEWLVFLEVTQGPFIRENSVFAEWSPVDDDKQAVENFVNKINKEIEHG
jgi:cupin fold WbuC family metalloprotein